MSAEESERVLKVVSGKYERNPLMGDDAMLKKLLWTKKREECDVEPTGDSGRC